MSNVPKDLKGLEYFPLEDSRELYETQFGKALWEFMKRPKNIELMEDAASRQRPAVEPLQDGLRNEFDSQFQDARREGMHRDVNRMIGDMALRIMCVIGYEVYRKRIRIRDGLLGKLFHQGSVYRKR